MSEEQETNDVPQTFDANSSAEQAGENLLDRFVSKLGKDALKYFPAMVLPSVLGFAGVAIFTRVLDPNAYGQYSLVMAAAAIAVAVFGGWLQQSVVRYLPRYREEGRLDEFIARLSIIVGLLAATLLVLSVIVYGVIRPQITGYERFFLWGVLLVVFQVTFSVYSAAFVGGLQPGLYGRYQIMQAVGRLLFALVFIFFVSKDAVGLIVGPVVAYFVLIPPMIRQLRIPAAVREINDLVDARLARTFFMYGLPIVGQFVAHKALEVSGRFVIGAFRGAEEVGIYAANYSLALVAISFVAGPVLFAAHPLIVSSWEGGNRDRIQEVIATCSRYFLLVTFPIAAFVCVFAEQIASVLFGEAFREGYVIIPIIVAGLVIFNFGYYGHKGLKLVEKTSLIFAIVLACAVVNIAANLALVPRYGYMGAAVASFIGYALYPFLVFWVTRKYLPWVIRWGTVLRIAFSTLAAAALWWFLRPDLTGGVLPWMILVGGTMAGFAVYAALIFFLGEVTVYEKRFISRQISRIRGRSGGEG